MLDDKEIDLLFKSALKVDDKPSEQVNQKILDNIQERENMLENKARNRFSVVILAAAAVLMMSVTVFAANSILSTKEVAENMGYSELSKAFEGKDAVQINESVTDEDYKITFLGMTTGNSLLDTEIADDSLKVKSMYAVVAIERADGTAMPDVSDDEYGERPFFVSPLIEGFKPWQYNICTMNGGYTEDVYEGIDYRIIECDNIEIFADHQLYLCVSDTSFYDVNAFNYNEETGEISVNDDYQGVNVLFELPIDEQKADKNAQKEYLKSLESSENEESADETGDTQEEKLDSYFNMSIDEIQQNTKLMKEFGQELTLDSEDNLYHFEYKDDSGESKGGFAEPDW